jgi:protein-S-isoprenylcysteine O-methyltransferase Ste14
MEPHASSGPDDAALQQLVDYLEQHRHHVSLEALRRQLLDAGHPPELVAAAVARVGGTPVQKPVAWPFGLLIMLANLVLLPILFGGLASLVTSLFPASNTNGLWLIAPLLAMGLALGGELIIGRRLTDGPRDRLGRALVWGAAFTLIALALLALLVGICVAVLFANLG